MPGPCYRYHHHHHHYVRHHTGASHLYNAGRVVYRSEHARQRRLEKHNQHRQKLRQRFAEAAAKQVAKKQLARVRAPFGPPPDKYLAG